MRWFFPSWNGDIRAESTEDGRTRLTMIQPTPDELLTLGRVESEFRSRGWWKADGHLWRVVKDGRRKGAKRQEVTLDAAVPDVATVLVPSFKPGEQTLTVIVYKDGEVETVDGTEGPAALARATAKAKKAKAKKAATVKRATPCCPQCEPGSVGPAREVLLEFLTDEQHAMWSADRCLVVRGGRSGHRYLLAHRNSEIAVGLGRIAFDMDDRVVMHFHDRSVPPEEEVLAAMLVLRYREDWLRNEATAFDRPVDTDGNRLPHYERGPIYDNPFGDFTDGIGDATFTTFLGSFFAGLDPSAAPDGVFQEIWEGIQSLVQPNATPQLSPEEQELRDSVRALASTSPNAVADLVVTWHRNLS